MCSAAILEQRVRLLEVRRNIISPPLVMESTPDALAWRVWRLRSRAENQTSKGPSRLPEIMPENTNMSLETVKKVVASLSRPEMSSTPWPKTDTDEELLSVLVQKLCHAVGNRWMILESIPVSIIDIYATAVEISLDSEVHIPGTRMCPPPPIWQRGKLPNKKKSCCGCCSCKCHNQTTVKPSGLGRILRTTPSISTISSDRSRKAKKHFQWLNKLLCWRRSKHISDGSTSSTASTRTILE
jgi:hypothetical protein